MKLSLLILSIVLSYTSCKENLDNKNNCPNQDLKHLMAYDYVDYYYSPDKNDDKLVKLYENDSPSSIDSIAKEVYYGGAPNYRNIEHLSNVLNSLDFVQKTIDQADFKFIDSSIHKERGHDSIFAACIHEFRDILVFRSKVKPVGMMKICFHCSWTKLYYDLSWESFGNGLDYGLMKKTVEKYIVKGDRKY